jgi:hypothetical protein
LDESFGYVRSYFKSHPSAFEMVKKLISCMRVLPQAVSIHLMNLRQSNFKQSVFDVYILCYLFYFFLFVTLMKHDYKWFKWNFSWMRVLAARAVSIHLINFWCFQKSTNWVRVLATHAVSIPLNSWMTTPVLTPDIYLYGGQCTSYFI